VSKLLRTLAIAVGLLVHGHALGGSPFGQLVIDVPAGLSGPHHETRTSQSGLDVFVSDKDLPPTLILLNRTTVPKARPGMSKEDEIAAASDFLVGFLRVFSKDVTGWTRSAPEPIQLGGYLAVRARWSGSYHGLPNSGYMYFFTVGESAYCLHVFGRDDVPNLALKASVLAIEDLRVALPSGADARKAQ
jgi:hypothetical protein